MSDLLYTFQLIFNDLIEIIMEENATKIIVLNEFVIILFLSFFSFSYLQMSVLLWMNPIVQRFFYFYLFV